jgi:formate hydrogenlyase transcriptional activator
MIVKALETSGWVVGGPYGAAAKLGMKRTTLIARMKKHAIFRPVEESICDQVLNSKLSSNQVC